MSEKCQQVFPWKEHHVPNKNFLMNEQELLLSDETDRGKIALKPCLTAEPIKIIIYF